VGLRLSERYGAEPTLADLAGRFLPGSRGLNLSEDPSEGEVAQAVAAAQGAERIVLTTFHWLGGFKEGQKALYRALAALGKPLYVVALGNPDDLRFLPGGPRATWPRTATARSRCGPRWKPWRGSSPHRAMGFWR
jgi:beta-N-acetylhexosaminidase